MATKDLNMAEFLDKLLNTGVKSLKIEGRMRSSYYLATVVSSYRKLIDNYYNGTLTEDIIKREQKILSRVANRENSTHFYMKEADYTDQYYTGRQEISNQDFLALVLDYDSEKGLIKVSQRNYFKIGDEIEIFTPSGETYSYTIKMIKNEKMEDVSLANHPEEILYIPFDRKIDKNSMIRIKVI